MVLLAGKLECLGIQPGQDKLAAMLETARFAAMREATTSVFKFSGLTYNGKNIVIGVESIIQGSLPITIKGKEMSMGHKMMVEPNPCGCLMSINLDSNLSATEMEPIACGIYEFDERNSCNTERLANPRSLTYIEPFDALLVGEESKNHQNNAVWLLNQESSNFVRIFTAPIKGSVTNLNWYQVHCPTTKIESKPCLILMNTFCQ